MGSEDQSSSNFFKGYLFRRGQVEHVLIMASLKLKPSLFTPLPTGYSKPGGGALNFFFGGCVPRGFQNVGSREWIFLEK